MINTLVKLKVLFELIYDYRYLDELSLTKNIIKNCIMIETFQLNESSLVKNIKKTDLYIKIKSNV